MRREPGSAVNTERGPAVVLTPLLLTLSGSYSEHSTA